ncbi:MAG TPA: AI-2E family transporter [Candidatus Bathyarchaeia archaeon]|nr:AI-2E family transporter [Candidatus Bathyarchaeia archaeon]
MIDIGTFFAERRYFTVVLLIAVFTAFLILLISWPWVNVIIVALWAAYILWWPARWLERRIHRRVLSSFIVMLLIIVMYVIMVFQVIYILANQLSGIALGAASSNSTLNSALLALFGPVSGGSGSPAAISVAAQAAQAGSFITAAFATAALSIVNAVIRGLPIYLFQLFIITLLVWYLLVVGDHVVAEFTSLAPRDHRGTVSAFLKHANSIYHALYVNYIFAAVISAIIAAVFFPLIGVPYALTAAFLMLTVGIIPVIGRALVYVPVSLYFWAIGDTPKAIGVLIASVIIFQVIVGTYLIPYLGRRGKAGIPKPVALLAYVVPFAAIGLIGVVVGPAVYGFALALYRTYRDKRNEEAMLAERPPPAGESAP